MQQGVVATRIIIKRLSTIFYSILKIFLMLNGVMMSIIVINIMKPLTEGYRANIWMMFVLMINFFIMLIFFFMLSMFIKLFICMSNENVMSQNDEDMSWIYSIIFFPLMNEINEEEFIQMIAQDSFDESNENETIPPTTEKLVNLETKWGFVLKNFELTEEKKEEKCLICANPYEYNFPLIEGCIVLTCDCSTVFHKKCLLEWFYFNEKHEEEEDKYITTCPSCRHAFSTS